MRTIEELQKLLVIDRNRLDDELVEQPQLYWEASEGYTEAAKNRDTSKFILERLEADCAHQIRGSQLEKISDKRVADQVIRDPNYVNQYELYLGYKATAEKWSALKDAFQQRSSMLRDLITLASIGYWGSGIANIKTTYADHYRIKQENKNRE